MSPRLTFACAALAAGLLGGSVAFACIEVEPRLVVEFAPGSAQIPGDQMVALMKLFDHARERPGARRVSVRGFSDQGSSDPKAWTPQELALADARARALSEAVRTFSSEPCVLRVALGSKPGDAPPDRTDATHGPRLARGLVVLEAPDTEYQPIEGVRVETDCGPPTPPRADAPKA